MKLFVLNESFDRKTMSDFSFFLLDCKKEGKKAVLLISSEGGSTTCLDAMVDMLDATKVPLITIGRGGVMSCGAVLFCLGDERYLLPHAELLIHDVSTYIRKETLVKQADLERYYRSGSDAKERIISLLGRKTGLTPEVFAEKCGHGEDWILTPEEWEKYNIVTDTSERWLEIIEKSRG